MTAGGNWNLVMSTPTGQCQAALSLNTVIAPKGQVLGAERRYRR